MRITNGRLISSSDGAGHEAAGAADPTRKELQQRPIACKLPVADIRVRIEMLRKEFIPGILTVEEIADGFVYWFRKSESELRKVADFALFESECCGIRGACCCDDGQIPAFCGHRAAGADGDLEVGPT